MDDKLSDELENAIREAMWLIQKGYGEKQADVSEKRIRLALKNIDLQGPKLSLEGERSGLSHPVTLPSSPSPAFLVKPIGWRKVWPNGLVTFYETQPEHIEAEPLYAQGLYAIQSEEQADGQ